ncbi:MAG: UDP-N-acetylmuramoyl-tripeptide--D-alanyl-D-alanine ligase [Cellvibrionaceae bacterium]|nr:UDP-N-acetylmuramoyl-tripeptide--D-alanyl-D-alanine ligase [Cellvibrionaceae bacterium]
MRLADLVKPLQARLVGSDVEFAALSTDSRQLNRGELFVALRGENFDGHDFVGVALDRGACAMVVEREIEAVHVPQLVVADSVQALGRIAAVQRCQFRGKLVAVTGSSGKTSVKGLLREVFAVAGEVVATQGNFNNHIGVPLSLMKLVDQDYAVIEIGTNHPGEIANLVNLAQPDIALVNNVSAAHIAGFGSLSAIAKEKGSIYSTLGEDNFAIINLDDAFAADFIQATAHVQQIGFFRAWRHCEFPGDARRQYCF